MIIPTPFPDDLYAQQATLKKKLEKAERAQRKAEDVKVRALMNVASNESIICKAQSPIIMDFLDKHPVFFVFNTEYPKRVCACLRADNNEVFYRKIRIDAAFGHFPETKSAGSSFRVSRRQFPKMEGVVDFLYAPENEQESDVIGNFCRGLSNTIDPMFAIYEKVIGNLQSQIKI